MAVNIGPRIGIDGEAEYRKQLNNIIQQQKTLAAEMRATESAFDKNASAQDKARAKTENLTKQIDLQRQRVDAAAKMVEESTKAYGDADDRTQKWKQVLADATTQLNNMERELSQIGSPVQIFGEQLSAAGERITSLGEKMSSFGNAMTTRITAPILALEAASLKAFSDVDKGMDTIVTKTGATGDALEGLQDSAKTIATTLPTSFQKAGEAVGEVNTRFGLTGKELEGLSSKFIKFAEINNVDVTQSVDSVQSAMAAWNVSTEDAGAILDTLTAVSQKTGASVSDLSSLLTSNAASLQEMGFSVADAASFLGQLSVNGVDSSAVLAGLKKALVNASKDGKTMQEAMSDLQTTLADSSNVDSYAAAIELFGAKAGPQLAQAIKDGRLNLEALGQAASDNLGVVDQTFENTLDAPDKLNVTLNNLKLTGADLAASLFTMLSPAIEKITEFAQKAAQWVTGLDDGQKQLIITIAGVLAAVGPAISVIGRVVTGIGGIVSVVGKLAPIIAGAAKAFVGFGSALLANPIGLVIAGITALVAGIVLLWNNCAWFRDGVKTVFSSIVGAGKSAYDWVVNAFNDIGNFFTVTIPGWFNTGISAVSGFVSNIKNKFDEIKQGITDKINAARDAVKGAIDKIKGFFNFDFKLPKIPLPHFSVAPPGWKFGDLLKGSIPSLSISWYRKAYDNPIVFTKPTVIPTARGLMGFGDGRGAEIVIGMNRFEEMLADAAASGSRQPIYSPTVNVYPQPGQDPGQIADEVMRRMQYAIVRGVS